jgi:hypothetical protein
MVDTFLASAQNSFEKRQAVICPFSKEFFESAGSKKGITVQKRTVHTVPVIRVFKIKKHLMLSGLKGPSHQIRFA